MIWEELLWPLAAAVVSLGGIVALLCLHLTTQKQTSRQRVRRWAPSKIGTAKTNLKYLVIGGHGLVGSHLVEALLARGEEDIWLFDIAPSPLFENEPNVHFIRGDIMNKDHLLNACFGRDVVFHTSALVNYWSRLKHDADKINQINYGGTKNVVSSSRSAQVKKLIFLSSSSIFTTFETFKKPIVNQREETMLYPEVPICHYTNSKILAEKLVLASNGFNGLLTAVLRPNGIYGPRDTWIGQMIFKKKPGLSTNNNKQNYIYVENLVHAILKLEEKLVPQSTVQGKAYFISDEEILGYWDFNTKFAKFFGHEFTVIPSAFATILPHIVEGIMWLTRGKLSLGELQFLTPVTMALGCTEYYYSTNKAKEDFDWHPLYTMEEGMQNTAKYFKSLGKEESTTTTTESKKDK